MYASKKTIMRHWLLPDSPTIDEWEYIVSEMYLMEKITFSRTCKLPLPRAMTQPHHDRPCFIIFVYLFKKKLAGNSLGWSFSSLD